MKYFSTKDPSTTRGIDLKAAILEGLAQDGGLYLPERIDRLDLNSFCADDDFQQCSEKLYAAIAPELVSCVSSAFDFPIHLREFGTSGQKVLELFHGPTAAFKDFGARLLAAAIGNISAKGERITILVATSGDTGGAVASAFEKKINLRVVILFPKGGVSPRQELQLGCWGEKVLALRVDGSFDDCQALVKRCFNDAMLQKKHRLTSANSINIARVLGQISYYAWSSLQAPDYNYVIPTGNLGNAFACMWAKKLGFPIQNIRLATNANSTLSDYFQKGVYEPRPSQPTSANAMDVGDPSNFERMVALFPTLSDLANFGVDAIRVDDETIRETIIASPEPICPHTACAMSARFEDANTIVVATAHPAKFETIVQPLIQRSVDLPTSLQTLIDRETQYIEMPNSFDSLASILNEDD